MTGTDVNGCINTASQFVRVNPLPIATFVENSGANNNDAVICTGDLITAKPLIGNSLNFDYTWNLPNGNVINGEDIYPSSGNYGLYITDKSTSCQSSTITISVVVNPIPTVAAIASQIKCNTIASDVINFSGTVSNTTYAWTNSQSSIGVASSGSGTISSTILTNSITSPVIGTFTITPSANSCAGPPGTFTITVNPTPAKPTVTSPKICEGETASVTMLTPTGTSTYTYTWTVPTGVATSTTKTVSTNKAGTYSLTITDANSCTSEVGTATVTVNPLPEKPTLTSQAICEGATATITGPTGTYTYTWQVPTGVATSTTKSVSTNKAGTYTLTITDVNSCTSEAGTATVTVNQLPAKPTLTSQAICEGTSATITGPTGTYTYTWQVPIGVATSTTKTISTTKAGTYSLTITDANSCTSEVGTATVTVNPLPEKPTLTSQAICEGATATITGPTGTYTYTWQVPTGVATSTTKSVSTNKAGTYTLTITDVNSCTSEAGTATVTVNQLPAKPTLTSQAICEGTSATITGPSGTYTYTWQVPTGVATSTIKSVITSKAGTYTLSITDANTCTSEEGTATVTVNALPPKPTLTSPVICEGATTTVTLSTPTGTNTYTYNWQVPTGVATSTSNSVTTTKAGTYSLTITDANTCTSEVGTGIVTVNAIPTFTISSPSVCLGATLTITANPITGAKSDYNYTWQVPNGASIPGNVSSFPATTAGVYTVTIKNKITNCESASLNNNAIFYPLPIAKTIVASDNKVIENKTLNLTAAASGGTSPYIFTWTPNSTMNYSISGQENAVFNAIKKGKVNIKFQVKDVNNCEAISGEYEITINGNSKPYNLPDAFTPNGDGKNDVFKIIVNDPSRVTLISFQIYNRNGILMFSTNRISEGWNGRHKDVMQDMGVYFVKLITVENGLDTPSLYLFK